VALATQIKQWHCLAKKWWVLPLCGTEGENEPWREACVWVRFADLAEVQEELDGDVELVELCSELLVLFDPSPVLLVLFVATGLSEP